MLRFKMTWHTAEPGRGRTTFAICNKIVSFPFCLHSWAVAWKANQFLLVLTGGSPPFLGRATLSSLEILKFLKKMLTCPPPPPFASAFTVFQAILKLSQAIQAILFGKCRANALCFTFIFFFLKETRTNTLWEECRLVLVLVHLFRHLWVALISKRPTFLSYFFTLISKHHKLFLAHARTHLKGKELIFFSAFFSTAT